MDKTWLHGIVVRGNGRGKELGFPTANIALDDATTLSKAGVYAVWAKVDHRKHMGAMHVGPRPTFGDEKGTVEIHLLDFETRGLYGEKISFQVVEKVRDVEKFDTMEGLVEAIENDCLRVREILLK